ncbi:hypothetical protein ACIRYZ_38915 [Kitasatospora sp. NPDC101155]|uniref:hypothetical protein n=1 Tax=Kitasatospora sp. NPDC101155 TaxID=3364097 RepID=UPI00381FCD99
MSNPLTSRLVLAAAGGSLATLGALVAAVYRIGSRAAGQPQAPIDPAMLATALRGWAADLDQRHGAALEEIFALDDDDLTALRRVITTYTPAI